jgi:hypothetical protein
VGAREAALPTWLRVAGIGLAVGGLFLHIWNFENSLTFWAGVGLALPAAVGTGAGTGVSWHARAR